MSFVFTSWYGSESFLKFKIFWHELLKLWCYYYYYFFIVKWSFIWKSLTFFEYSLCFDPAYVGSWSVCVPDAREASCTPDYSISWQTEIRFGRPDCSPPQRMDILKDH